LGIPSFLSSGTGIVEATQKKFWSTKDPGQKVFTFKIGVGGVIPAWDQGVLTMQVGESARIRATHEVAYGEQGFPAWGIPPNATLLFDIELLKVE
jgi:FKBP-type peptidyl-prolyl cis-trans isomerase